MTIAVPYFGETAKFRPLLERWFAAARDAGVTHDVVLLTNEINAEHPEATMMHGCGVAHLDVSGFRDLIRPGQPFDMKGAIVCSYLLTHSDPVLVIDADAFMSQDPEPHLRKTGVWDAPIAMPLDHGAMMYSRSPRMDPPYHAVRKQCAGVQWFGPDPHGARSRLVAGYRRAFLELTATDQVPWTPQLQHLVEQYAWSVCAHRRGGARLSVLFNWHEDHLGKVPHAVINHHFGHPKWANLPAPDALLARRM